MLRLDNPRPANDGKPCDQKFGRRLLTLGLLLMAVISAGGWFYYQYQSTQARAAVRESLSAIADLKADEISNWLKERRGDAEVARASALAIGAVTNAGSPAERADALRRTEIFRKVYGYAAVVFTDAQGRVQLKAPADYPLADVSLKKHIQAALHSKGVQISDLNRDTTNGPILMWLECPVAGGLQTNSALAGAAVFIIDPRTFLYPAIQKWPALSRTAETLIVRREGEGALFLNELRFRTNSALNIRASIALTPQMPAVKAVQGVEDIVEGVDYRGMPVFSTARKIPEMPWFMVAKIDKEEVLAPLHTEAWNVGIITALLLVASLMGIGLLWRQQKLADANANEARLQMLIEEAPTAISISREKKIIYVNQKWLALYGHKSAADATGQSIVSQLAPEFRGPVLERAQRRARGEPVASEYEVVGLRSDGSRFPMHVAVANVELSDGRASLAFLTDMTERKRVEESLKLFRALIDRSNDSIEIIDAATGRILDVNERALQQHGYNREEFLALTIPQIDPQFATDEESWRGHLEALKQTGFSVFETEHRRKDGSVFPVEVNANYVRLERDYILAVVRDITERKLAERHIHHLNRVYAVLSGINTLIVHERNLQAMFEGACKIAAEKGGFRLAWIGLVKDSGRAIELAAHSAREPGTLAVLQNFLTDPALSCAFTERALATGHHAVCNDVAHAPEAAPWRDLALQQGFRSLVSLPLNVNGQRAGVFNLYADVENFFDSDELGLLDELAGDIGFALAVHQKETERQRAEEDLRANEERFRLLIENASDIIAVINRKGLLQFVGPSVKSSLGYEPEELLHSSVFERIEPQDVEKAQAALSQVLSDSTLTVSVEFRFKHKNGSWRILQSIGRSIPGQSPDGLVVVNARDVTESRAMEMQFRQAQKMEAIGQLAGGVAHDFNNILAVIQMQADLLQATQNLSGEQAELADEIANASQRAAALTHQLLLFSRKETARMQDLDVNKTVNNMTKMLRRVIGADVQVQFKFAMETLFVHADAGMLDQVLVNLVVNARDAMPGGGKIVIETSGAEIDELSMANFPEARPGSFVCLSVSDTGTGISPEILPKIFEPFFTTKEVGKGTGLGLATVFGIVQQHRGWINVYSEVGQGTVFRIYLPRIATASEPVVARPAFNTVRGGSETILMVEDDAALRVAMRKALSQLGYQVLDAANASEAILIWEQKRDDVVLLLTDLVMPGGMNGKDLAARFLAEKPGLKVIYASGYSAEIAGKDFPLREGVNFLTKPFQALKLARAIRDNLDEVPG